MATIALYAGKINQMPWLIKDVKKSVMDYQSELSTLRAKSLSVNKSVCNLDDVIGTIQASSNTQEDKIASLEAFSKNSEQFISDTVRIDNGVASVVKKRKDDFYDKYNYLKPECEKSGWEKFCEGFNSAVEWCKKHWVTILTAAVVILVAAVAAICGVAIAFIAAIASLVALTLCIADIICMLVTGGKGIADVLRENGFTVLADIFSGVSIGADIVAIVFPVAAAIKSMVKIGVKRFFELSINAVKAAFKEGIEKVFKSGFKNGIKNLGKILFKTFVFDIDDLTRIENGKRILDLWEPSLDPLDTNHNWTIDGNKLIPNQDFTPARGSGGHNNPDGLSMQEILKKYDLESIPLKRNGDVDWSSLSLKDVEIKRMSGTREGLDGNYLKANAELKKINTSKIEIQKEHGSNLTWHEYFNLKKMGLVPTEIHGNINHNGGIANFKFISGRAPAQLDNILDNIFKFSGRKASMAFAE